MVCRCDEISELWDADAKACADKHLEQVEARAGGWEVVYRCPDSEHTWLEDYPRGEEHGGGPMHLRRLD
jgi:Immunity protein 27